MLQRLLLSQPQRLLKPNSKSLASYFRRSVTLSPQVLSFNSTIRRINTMTIANMASIETNNAKVAATEPEVELDEDLIITEGQAKIQQKRANEVFYNKVQVLNRDLSIAVLNYFGNAKRASEEARVKKFKAAHDGAEPTGRKAFSDGITVFEALSATGLRSIRYFKEVPSVKSILVNDLDPTAVEAIRRNIEYNGLDDTSSLIPNLGDATMVMYEHRDLEKQFDVVDLDPYGSAAPFIDGAVQSVKSGGLLCITCTDMAVLSGNNPEMCFSRYGAVVQRTPYLHEMALRVLLASIELSANRYGRHIVPVISCSIDFYIRVFVRVYHSPKAVKASSSKSGLVYQCHGCDSFHIQPRSRFNKNHHLAPFGPTVPSDKCEFCNSKLKLTGPVWTDPIHDMDAVNTMKKAVESQEFPPIPTQERLHGLLTTVSEEVVDAPLHYVLPHMCSTLRCESPPMNLVKAALMNAGYKVSQSHKNPDAIKTNAPNNVMWDIMRCWVKKHPLNKRRENVESPGNTILATEPTFQADFTVPASLRHKPEALRFPQNPEAFWGPKRRAVGNKNKKDSSSSASPPPAKREKTTVTK